MQGRPPVICPPDVACAIDKMSKGTLIDLINDLAVRATTQPVTDDYDKQAVIRWLQESVNYISELRGQPTVNLTRAMESYDSFAKPKASPYPSNVTPRVVPNEDWGMNVMQLDAARRSKRRKK